MQASAPTTCRNLCRTFHLTQLKRSSLHLERHLVFQKMQEHEMSLEALKERMLDLEKNITSTTLAVGDLHCYMNKVSIPIPDIPENVASSIMFSEVTLTLLFHIAPRLTCLTGPKRRIAGCHFGG